MKCKNNVLESFLTPVKGPGKIIQKQINKSSFHIIAIACGLPDGVRVGKKKKNQVRENADSTPEEFLCNALFRILTFQWTFSRHGDGPANFIPFGTFHCSVRCTLLSYAERGEEGEETGVNWGSIHMQTSARTQGNFIPSPGPWMHWCFPIESTPFICKSKRHC